MGTRMDGSSALWVEEDRVIEGGLGIPANLKCHMHTMVRAQTHSKGSLKRAALFTAGITLELSSGQHFSSQASWRNKDVRKRKQKPKAPSSFF